jgi:ABC-type amino acid transport substrate-binding protein
MSQWKSVLVLVVFVGFSYTGSAGTEGYVIGVQSGTTADSYAADNLPNATINAYDSIDLAVAALEQGDVDFVLGDLPTLMFYQADSDGLSIAGSFSEENLGIGVAHGESDLLAAINVALGEIIDSGEYGTIFAATFGDEIVILADDTDAGTATAYPAEPTDTLASVLEGEELIFGTDPYYPPFESYDGGTVVGFDADMAAAIGAKIAAAYDQSLNVTMKEKTWDDLLAFAYDDYDATLSAMTKTVHRAEKTDFSRAYWTSSQGILASGNSPSISGVEDLDHGIYANEPPVSTIDSINSYPNDKVYFNGSSTDVDGEIISYRWTSSIDGMISEQRNFSTSDLSIGYHTIILEVLDNEGAWSSPVSQELRISASPVAIAGQDISTSPGSTVQFSGAGTDDGSITKYEWDFDGDGIFEWSSNENGLTTFIYNNAGTYTVTLRVTDDGGKTATDSLTVTVKSPEEDAGDSDVTVTDAKEDESGLPSLSLLAVVGMLGIVSILKRR